MTGVAGQVPGSRIVHRTTHHPLLYQELGATEGTKPSQETRWHCEAFTLMIWVPLRHLDLVISPLRGD